MQHHPHSSSLTPYVLTGSSVPNILSFLHTNDPPNEKEAEHFSRVLTTAVDRERWLDSEIHYLQSNLTKCAEELNHVKRVIHEHKLVLSPARRLPTELLVEIFFLVLRNEQVDDVLDLSRGLWPLSQVCGSWRAAIIEHIPFWTTVYLPWRIHYPQYAVHILALFLERSKSSPLTIDFACRDVPVGPTNDFTRTILGVLMSQSHRWETCRLKIPIGVLKHLAESRIARSARIIRSLELSLDLPFGTSQLVWFYDIFADAKELRSVKLGGIPIISTNLRLPWAQLTTYDAYQEFPENHLMTLRSMTSLVECTLSSKRPWHRVPQQTDVLRMPKLKRMTLVDTANLLVQFLTTPALQSLSTTCATAANTENAGTGDEDTVLEKFLERSRCRLKDLEIESDPLDETVLAILKHSSVSRSLNKLVLNVMLGRGSSAFKDLFEILRYRHHNRDGRDEEGSARASLVNLEELKLSVYQNSKEDLYAREMVGMVLSRWNFPIQGEAMDKGWKRMKRFMLEANSYWLPEFDALQELKEEGLDVVVDLR
ncbi:hypothetical protein GYMLUDRAFT_39790 [Collybiopsis luxurians FD-317 M1]|nr:hypothetical protein GYMLUDRAFT_39790 [Collybiopsis luxurians FD-317 M1]